MWREACFILFHANGHGYEKRPAHLDNCLLYSMCTRTFLYDVQSASKVSSVFCWWVMNMDIKRALYTLSKRGLHSVTRALLNSITCTLIIRHDVQPTSDEESFVVSYWWATDMDMKRALYREVGGWGRHPKNVRGEIGGWGRVPFNEAYAPSLSTIYDGA